MVPNHCYQQRKLDQPFPIQLLLSIGGRVVTILHIIQFDFSNNRVDQDLAGLWDRCGAPFQNRWHRTPPNADPVPQGFVPLAWTALAAVSLSCSSTLWNDVYSSIKFSILQIFQNAMDKSDCFLHTIGNRLAEANAFVCLERLTPHDKHASANAP